MSEQHSFFNVPPFARIQAPDPDLIREASTKREAESAVDSLIYVSFPYVIHTYNICSTSIGHTFWL